MINAKNQSPLQIIKAGNYVDHVMYRGSKIWQQPDFPYIQINPYSNNSNATVSVTEPSGSVKNTSVTLSKYSSNRRIRFISETHPFSKINISNIDAEEVIFHKIDFTQINTWYTMFANPAKIRAITMDQCVVPRGHDLSSCFYSMNLLNKLIIKDTDIDSPSDLSYFIESCPALKTVDLSGIHNEVDSFATGPKWKQGLISYCDKLENIDISGFKLTRNFFFECDAQRAFPAWIIYLIGDSGAYDAKIKISTTAFCSLWHTKIYNPTANVGYHPGLTEVINSLASSSTDAAAAIKAQLRNGTHPKITISDVADYPDIWS